MDDRLLDTPILTGMIDTDITFNPKNHTYFFVIDGRTWHCASQEIAELHRNTALKERELRLRAEVEEQVQASLRARELDEEWLERAKKPDTDKGDPIHTLKTTIAWQNWEALVQAYHDAQHAGYEPEETGEILYDLIREQLGEQGSD